MTDPSGPGRLPARCEVLVVGAGLAGAAIARSLARRGRDTVVVEQFTPANALGSSHGSARIVRRAYPDALYVRLTGRAMELWRELERESQQPLLTMTGGLDFGRDRDPVRLAEALAEQSVPHELISAEEAGERWPGMVFEGPVLHHPEAGTVDAERAVDASLRGASAAGARLLTGVGVERLDPGADAVTVTTQAGTIRAGTVVVAAGAWTAPLLGGLVRLPDLRVTEQQVFHFPMREPGQHWPVALHRGDLDVYSLPGGRDGGAAGRKIAEHTGMTTTATDRSGRVDPEARARLVRYVERWLPGLSPEPYGETTCLYTWTPTEDFILDRVDRLVVCSPCSGHGAKFAPLIGELAADLVAGAPAEPRFTLAGQLSTA